MRNLIYWCTILSLFFTAIAYFFKHIAMATITIENKKIQNFISYWRSYYEHNFIPEFLALSFIDPNRTRRLNYHFGPNTCKISYDRINTAYCRAKTVIWLDVKKKKENASGDSQKINTIMTLAVWCILSRNAV